METLIAILNKVSSDLGGLLQIGLYFLGAFVLYQAYKFMKYDGMLKRGLVYQWGGGSDANPPRKLWLSGHTWTNLAKLQGFSQQNLKKGIPVKFNQFRYFDNYAEVSKMPKFIRDRHEKNDIYFDARDMARGVLVVGSAGSGKTEFVNTIISQNFYKKAVVFSKKGDFEQFFFRPGIDILVNPKLESGVIHNVLGEDIQYIMEYINTLMNASIGKSQDYFSGSAKQKLENFCQRIKIKEKDDSLDIRGKWMALIQFYEDAMESAMNDEQKSEKDIMSTVRATMNLLYLSAYRIEQGARTFTVKDFFSTPDRTKLFLNSTDKSMDGMLAATAAVLIKYQLAMKDISLWDPDFLVAWFLDEYLSFAAVIDDELLAEISRVGRSKGIVPLKFVQSLPSKIEERKELTSNVQYMLIFATTERETTIKTVSEQIGQIEYEHVKLSESFTGNKKTVNKSMEVIKDTIVKDYQINILQNESFSHILFSPKREILYKGYTPPMQLMKRDYIDVETEIDLTEFYRWKIEREDNLKKLQDAAKTLANKN